MGQRYDVLATRRYKTGNGEEKTAWTNVGVAFEQKDGKGFSVNLHCVPVPDKETGEIRLVMRIPQPKEGGGGPRGGGGQRPSGGASGGYEGGGGYGPGATDEDSIPFAPVGDVG